jgi:uncharacterized protein YjeT (DUF2065 family)
VVLQKNSFTVMSENFLTALGLMLILEGLMPLLLPQSWRETFKKMIEFNDGQLRFIGLSSVACGLVLLLLK